MAPANKSKKFLEKQRKLEEKKAAVLEEKKAAELEKSRLAQQAAPGNSNGQFNGNSNGVVNGCTDQRADRVNGRLDIRAREITAVSGQN